jgi:hypothetical protein
MRNNFSALCYEAFHAMRKTGGFTINLQGPVTQGYAVGQGMGTKVPAFSLTPKYLEHLLHDTFGDLMVQGACVGCWIHKGEAHIEISRVYSEKDAALTDAYRAGEIAIYDLSNKVEIKVEG